ncbi:hypothetical protein ZWY2020_005392 [Hordeum vulgare]|nr:hypothetical protein ZWY2020_005392 [Hordeum vulgare]
MGRPWWRQSVYAAEIHRWDELVKSTIVSICSSDGRSAEPIRGEAACDSRLEETESMVANGTCVGAWIKLHLQRQGEAELGKVKTDAMAAQGVVQADVTAAGSAMVAQAQRRLRVKTDPIRARRDDRGTDEAW